MRAIRQLPPFQETAPKGRSRDRRPWSVAQRVFFTVGLLIMSGGLATAGYFQLGRSQLPVEETKWDNLDEALKRIDSMTLDQTWESWTLLRDQGIGPYNPPNFVIFRLYSSFWMKRVTGGLIAALVGAVLIGVAFLIPSPSKRQASARSSTQRPPRASA